MGSWITKSPHAPLGREAKNLLKAEGEVWPKVRFVVSFHCLTWNICFYRCSSWVSSRLKLFVTFKYNGVPLPWWPKSQKLGILFRVTLGWNCRRYVHSVPFDRTLPEMGIKQSVKSCCPLRCMWHAQVAVKATSHSPWSPRICISPGSFPRKPWGVGIKNPMVLSGCAESISNDIPLGRRERNKSHEWSFARRRRP